MYIDSFVKVQLPLRLQCSQGAFARKLQLLSRFMREKKKACVFANMCGAFFFSALFYINPFPWGMAT